MEELRLLLMLLTANGSPIAARMLMGAHLDARLDGGRRLADGQPILGVSKTIRGVIAATLATTLLGVLLGYAWQIGALIGLLAMVGDALSSFIKRRLGMPSGSMALGLDHLPESILPLLACKPLLNLTWVQIAILGIVFMLSNLLLSRVLYFLGVRQHPY